MIPPVLLPRVAVHDVAIRSVIAPPVLQALAAVQIFEPAITWAVAVEAVDIGGFRFSVLGIRYRSAHSRLDEVSEGDVPPAEPVTGEPSGHVLSSRALATRSDQRPLHPANPYAALYGLLYPPPDELAADFLPQYTALRPYQRTGVEFLIARESALLADDMGLGKTAQCSIALAVLLRSERIRRALIVCPRALVRQWEHEAKRWAGLYARPIVGNAIERRSMWNGFPGAVIATPHIVLNDIETVARNHFDLVICDDISMLKNAGKITSAIRGIPRERSWCMSGTPLENRPEDLANVMEFVKPGLFTAAERERAPTRETLQRRVAPHFLRRRKIDCLTELPDKQSFEPTSLEMTGRQAEAYRRAEAQEWDALQQLGVKATKMHVFAHLNILLQLCNFHEASGESAKAEEVGEQLDILFDSGSETKAVVFSMSVKALEFLKRRWGRYHPLLYHGGLSPTARSDVLDRFAADGRLLLMSTKAGSRGLNLQHCSYVYHFDRTWNPMDELQAEDRCWRMGQASNVFVYRFLQVGTIEERIHEVLTRKQRLFLNYIDSMAEDTDALAERHWSVEELIELMRPAR